MNCVGVGVGVVLCRFWDCGGVVGFVGFRCVVFVVFVFVLVLVLFCVVLFCVVLCCVV